MAENSKRRARDRAKRAQERFQRAQSQRDQAAHERREEFRRAADSGLSMAEIGEAVGLHRGRVNQIINGK